MLSFDAIELALIAWLEPSIGTGKVILSKQKGPQPAVPYATISITGPRPASSPWPSLVQSYDAAQPQGSEIEMRAVFEREITVSVQAYTAATRGDSSAKALLSRAGARLGLPGVLDALRAAGLALVGTGDTQDVSALLDTAYQGRAALDLQFLVSDEVAERTGYVETLGITGGATT